MSGHVAVDGRPESKIEPGLDPVVDVYKPGIDLSLIDRNLRLTPEERLCQLMELQRFAEELARAGHDARR